MSVKKRKTKGILWFMAILSTILFVFCHLVNNVKKVYESVSVSQIKSYIYQTVNLTAEKLIDERKGTTMLSTKQNADGEVVSILIDTDNVNDLSNDIAVKCQQDLSVIEQSLIVHIGAFTGFRTLVDKGRSIMIPMTVNYFVKSDLKAYSEKIGINVIRYALYLRVTTDADIVLPMGGTPQQFINYILIAEIVFTSEVPDTFIASDDGLGYLDLLP